MTVICDLGTPVQGQCGTLAFLRTSINFSIIKYFWQTILNEKLYVRIPVAKQTNTFPFIVSVNIFLENQKFKFLTFAQIERLLNSCTNVLRLVSAIQGPPGHLQRDTLYLKIVTEREKINMCHSMFRLAHCQSGLEIR